MTNSLVLVIVDGMKNQVARERLGFAESMVEQGLALRATARSVLPSLSRVCYEAIFTGTEPMVNGILTNETVRRSKEESIFDVLRNQDRTSGVFGYHWISELYQSAPFNPIRDRDIRKYDHGITYGRFYFEDDYPDSHLYAEAEALRQDVHPDLLVIHSMNVDLAGHRHGSDSPEYAGSVIRVDTILATLVPQWLADGYQVVITSDHGMDAMGYHGGTLSDHRTVPVYIISNHLRQFGTREESFLQVELADLLCRLLEVPKADAMAKFPDDLYQQWFKP